MRIKERTSHSYIPIHAAFPVTLSQLIEPNCFITKKEIKAEFANDSVILSARVRRQTSIRCVLTPASKYTFDPPKRGMKHEFRSSPMNRSYRLVYGFWGIIMCRPRHSTPQYVVRCLLTLVCAAALYIAGLCREGRVEGRVSPIYVSLIREGLRDRTPFRYCAPYLSLTPPRMLSGALSFISE